MSRLSLGLAVAFQLALGPAAPAQSTAAYSAGWGDGAVLATLAGLGIAPVALGLPEGPPDCAPCDPARLPGIDRWVVGTRSPTAATASDVLVLGVMGGAAWAVLRPASAPDRLANAVVMSEALAAAYAVTGWIKVAAARERPILYTADAPAAAGEIDNRRSFPSSHTAAAFAAATAYLVVARRQALPHRGRTSALLFVGATTVGALRVAAGRHFPTDVLGGAALGALVGWLVPTLHP